MKDGGRKKEREREEGKGQRASRVGDDLTVSQIVIRYPSAKCMQRVPQGG